MTRATTPQEVFDAMPSRFNAAEAGDLNAVIQFDLSGEGGGQWVATIAGGKVSVNKGVAPDANLTLGADVADYMAMINGELNAMNAFMQGKVRIKGDPTLVLRLQKLFGM